MSAMALADLPRQRLIMNLPYRGRTVPLHRGDAALTDSSPELCKVRQGNSLGKRVMTVPAAGQCQLNLGPPEQVLSCHRHTYRLV